jgi:hypothetical protein
MGKGRIVFDPSVRAAASPNATPLSGPQGDPKGQVPWILVMPGPDHPTSPVSSRQGLGQAVATSGQLRGRSQNFSRERNPAYEKCAVQRLVATHRSGPPFRFGATQHSRRLPVNRRFPGRVTLGPGRNHHRKKPEAFDATAFAERLNSQTRLGSWASQKRMPRRSASASPTRA